MKRLTRLFAPATVSRSGRTPESDFVLQLSLLAAAFMLWIAPLGQAQEKTRRASPGSTVIVNAQVADGTGAPLKTATVRITADRISQVGEFRPRNGEHLIDAKGLV